MTQIEAMKLALEALKKCRYRSLADEIVDPAIKAIEKALAQPEQEPVAIKRMKEWIEYLKYLKRTSDQHMKIPSEMSAGTCWELAIELEQFINTTPPQPEPVIDKSAAIRIATSLGWTPQRKPLTDEEISEIAINNLPMVHEFARAIEAAHGIKENT